MFERFTVVPSIDLKEGAVVRLLRGEMGQATVYETESVAVGRRFAEQGAQLIHVVDLDGAVAGEPRNLAAIRAICRSAGCPIDVSGGLRTADSVRAAVAAGARFVSIGSAAFLNPGILEWACTEFPGQVFGSLDLRGGRLAIKGWIETTELTLAQAAERFGRAGVAALIVTDISRDGTESGADITLFSKVAAMGVAPVIASGGVAGLDDLRKLKALFGIGVVGMITGRALYERRFTLPEALAAADSD
jgi:phosphoribosylformimino-5-aminoimidazole carboxamide ribotide isomerase